MHRMPRTFPTIPVLVALLVACVITLVTVIIVSGCDCDTRTVTAIPSDSPEWNCLLSNGAKIETDDGMEALYVPRELLETCANRKELTYL